MKVLEDQGKEDDKFVGNSKFEKEREEQKKVQTKILEEIVKKPVKTITWLPSGPEALLLKCWVCKGKGHYAGDVSCPLSPCFTSPSMTSPSLNSPTISHQAPKQKEPLKDVNQVDMSKEKQGWSVGFWS